MQLLPTAYIWALPTTTTTTIYTVLTVVCYLPTLPACLPHHIHIHIPYICTRTAALTPTFTPTDLVSYNNKPGSPLRERSHLFPLNQPHTLSLPSSPPNSPYHPTLVPFFSPNPQLFFPSIIFSVLETNSCIPPSLVLSRVRSPKQLRAIVIQLHFYFLIQTRASRASTPRPTETNAFSR
ncbi:hypothetical protein BJ166DRAFT_365720 [Pestalotiopsis sp. NC0098]|nr:hypothetical protein BJ166DRAFT_365720 [Pestalotiopsis sp. NC0098]